MQMSKVERSMWENRGYYASNGGVHVDPRSPKCWTINQSMYESDDDESSYSPTSLLYDSPQTEGRETGHLTP
jgi:hypothetical protein